MSLLKGGTTYEKKDILNYLENGIDTGFEFQCKLSQCSKVLDFMRNVFSRFVRLFYSGLYVYAEHRGLTENIRERAINTIVYYFKPEETSSSSNNKYVLKPGIHDASVLVALIVDSNEMNGKISAEFSKYSLSEMMGSLYIFCTKSMAYDILLQSYIVATETISPTNHHLFLRENLRGVFEFQEVLDNYFGLKHDFTLKDLVGLDTDVKIQIDNERFVIKETDKKLVLSLMVNNTLKNESDSRLITIPRVGDLNNKEFIRKRKDRPTSNEYQYKNIIDMPRCPVFYSHKNKEIKKMTDKTFMVKGDEWYNLTADGFFKKIMDQHGRTSLAGPSGSTMMWIVFVFGLLGYDKKNIDICRRLLCCVICDFVPIYHTLSEVLIIFSRELSFGKPYYINDSPIKWLYSYLLDKDIDGTISVITGSYEQLTPSYLECIDVILKNRVMTIETVASVKNFLRNARNYIKNTCNDKDDVVWNNVRVEAIKGFLVKIIDIYSHTKNITVPEYIKGKYILTSDDAFWKMSNHQIRIVSKNMDDDLFVAADEWPIMRIHILYHECLKCFFQFDERTNVCDRIYDDMLGSLCARASVEKLKTNRIMVSKSVYSKLSATYASKSSMSVKKGLEYPIKSISILKTPSASIKNKDSRTKNKMF